jgi:hypothetical protein
MAILFYFIFYFYWNRLVRIGWGRVVRIRWGRVLRIGWGRVLRIGCCAPYSCPV